MAGKWLDVALTQLGKSYHSSGAFVAFVMNTSKIETNAQNSQWSPTLNDLVQEVPDLKDRKCTSGRFIVLGEIESSL